MKPGIYPLFDIRVNRIKRLIKERGYNIFDERSTKSGRSFTVNFYSMNRAKQERRVKALNKAFEQRGFRSVTARMLTDTQDQYGNVWTQYRIRVYVAIEDDEKMSDDEIYEIAMIAHRYENAEKEAQHWAEQRVKKLLKGK